MYSCKSQLFEMKLIISIKMDLALNNLQRLICHKIQTTNQPTNQPTNYRRMCLISRHFEILPIVEHSHTHTHILTHAHVCTHAYIDMHRHVRTHIYTHVYIYTHASTYTQTYWHTPVQMYRYIHIVKIFWNPSYRLYSHTNTHLYLHTLELKY